MSYFAAQVGASPLAAPHPLQLWPEGRGWRLLWPAPPPRVQAVVLFRGAQAPLPEVARLSVTKRRWSVPETGGGLLQVAWVRGEEVGPRSVPLTLSTQIRAAPPAEDGPRRCPLCQSVLLAVAALWHCQGRCAGRWLESDTGQLLDLASLPYGICHCCERPSALVRGEGGACCPRTSALHLLLPDGQVVLAEQVQGRCPCCVPPMPLIPDGESLICAAKPQNRYQRVGGALRPLAAPPGSTELWSAIDQALSQNNAQLGPNGLFLLDE